MRFLTGFVDELRAIGIPVSMVEVIDAGRALEQTDLGSREQVKATLGATLIKSARHIAAFETAFEVFFALRGPEAGTPEGEERRSRDAAMVLGGGGSGGEGSEDLTEALYRALREGDSGLGEAAIREAISRLAGMEPGRPVGGAFYLYRVLRNIDLNAMKQRLIDELAEGASDLERRLITEDVERRIEELREALRSEIRRRLVEDRGSEAVARTLRKPLVEDIDLVSATREDIASLEAAVHPLTRKLASRLARRARVGDKGRLDVRRTIRRSLSSGGVALDPAFRAPRPARPEIILLADISGSVATFARFTMQMVYAISSQFRRVRSFAFIDTTDEVTGIFRPGVDFGEAMRRVGSEAEVVWLDGHSDYGNSFRAFIERFPDAVTPRSTVIVTGDARSNYHEPDVAALGAIARECRALYWLNPEQSRYWDTGDSIMSLYAPVCDGVFEVRNLRQLEQFVEKVSFPTTRPHRRIA